MVKPLQWRNGAKSTERCSPGALSNANLHRVRIRPTFIILDSHCVSPVSLFLSFVFDLSTHHLHTAASWRIPIGFQLIWGGILFSGIFFLPESP